jgi:hypothetical protein
MIFRTLFSILFFFAVSVSSVAQFMGKNENDLETTRKRPVSFTHQPFLLLKITPTAIIGRDNVLQYGVELAPPFGKFSFGFDYGTGKGSKSLNKEQKAKHPEQETRIIRGEIRGYFSDWYPFYALDKKPFGRYYALEYVQKDIKYGGYPIINLYGGTQVQGLGPADVDYVERALHVKFGNHFIVTQFFFIDAYAGIGIGQYSGTQTAYAIEQVSNKFTFGKAPRDLTSKGLFLSKTAGVRLCLPI